MGFFSSLFGGKKGGSSPINFPAPPPPPPKPLFLRPVEQQITDILLRRSRGEDVGFDPRRLQLLKETFDIDAQRQREQGLADIHNQLSGSGQSRNLAAQEALIGNALRDAGRERAKYFNTLDVEDLTRRNQERDINTARLQDLNAFNFGQENQVANFGLGVFNTQTQQALAQAEADQANRAFQASQSGGFGAGIGGLLGTVLPGGGGNGGVDWKALLGQAGGAAVGGVVGGPGGAVLGSQLGGAFLRRRNPNPLFVAGGNRTNFFPDSLRNAPYTRVRLGGF